MDTAAKEREPSYVHVITAPFSPKLVYKFTVFQSLEWCVARLQWKPSPPKNILIRLIILPQPDQTVEIYPILPTLIHFSMCVERQGRYSFTTKFRGILEELTDSSTRVMGELTVDKTISRVIVLCAFVIWGLLTGSAGGFILSAGVGMFLGPMSSFLDKRRKLIYLEALFDPDNPNFDHMDN